MPPVFTGYFCALTYRKFVIAMSWCLEAVTPQEALL